MVEERKNDTHRRPEKRHGENRKVQLDSIPLNQRKIVSQVIHDSSAYEQDSFRKMLRDRHTRLSNVKISSEQLHARNRK